MERSAPPARAAAPSRFVFVDGLRGLAALGVAVLHLAHDPLAAVSPVAGAIAARGGWGVWIFFVISGFVISHSLGRVRVTLPIAGQFLLRRMARLDPPYWASMVLGYLVVNAADLVLRGHGVAPPSATTLLAHVAYLQYILDVHSLSDVYWTLCLEIQFYLLLALLIALRQRAERRLPEEVALALVFGPVLLWSFLSAVHLVPTPRGSCFLLWYTFATGVAAQRVAAGRGFGALVVAGAVGLAVTIITRSSEGAVAVATAGAIAAAHVLGRLGVWLSSRPFQYLGRISYSLYLVHGSVGGRAMNAIRRLLPQGAWADLVAAGLGLVVAIASADVLWRLVERPSIELGRWLAERMREPVVTVAPSPTSE
jgi:peptidoglycan/LPS O-acetylase OafA/YrhL